MNVLNANNQAIFLLVITTVLLAGCAAPEPSVQPKPAATSNPTPNTKPSTPCDEMLWQHVYDPTRLEVVDSCKTVTGTIDELDQNEDGDTHMLLKLDAGQDDLLTKRNRKKKDADLVIEIVCGGTVKDKKAKEACRDYTNTVNIPRVGDHVAVTGSYVIDSHNDWAEIHPVTAIVPRAP